MDNNLEKISRYIRSLILRSTTAAGSGHPTSSLSAVELMVGLMYGGEFRYKVNDPKHHNNDRLIFSKGHASPLLYALWSIAGKPSEEELMKLRAFDSPLEGHPTNRFAYTEAVTGSLGQGLSIGIGMALAAKMDSLSYRTYVLLGDSEMSEGQNWEAMQLAVHYKLNNLIGVIDVNRLGQRGETMMGHNTFDLERKCRSFGWETHVVDGHNMSEVLLSYQDASFSIDKPVMIIGKTYKGRGVSFLEDKEGWHGKTLSEEELSKALSELGEVEKTDGALSVPEEMKAQVMDEKSTGIEDDYEENFATRRAYGHGLVKAKSKNSNLVVLDAEMSNSTFSETYKNLYPQSFFEMYIAEQNMISVGVGLALRGKIPFMSSFAAFLSRAHDQIRMAQFSGVGINIAGSHAGVSMGADGFSQMGLDDIAMYRSILGSVVLYPSDHVSTEKLTELMMSNEGVSYLRLTRADVVPIYSENEEFTVGGSKTLRSSESDVVTVIGAGITLHEALKAYEILKKDMLNIRIIDLYSIKPLDVETLVKACKETQVLIVVEDHFAEGGMVEAVRSVLIHETTPVYSLAVRKMPRSGTPEELMRYEEIDSQAIVEKIEEIVG